ncbi:hypothetical protein HIM_01060 [Hirsutella minnesotensis 3608]|nr:hypothetical protein HIM_01060 [Hirsutella minnesotensis 3608]
MAAGIVRRSMADRSLRVLVSPTPMTFAERRSVLQALEQHGPVEVFRMTPGYHSNYISVTKDEATARRLVARSPLIYRLPASREQSDTSLADLDGRVAIAPGSPRFVSDSDPGPAEADGEAKSFTLEIFPQPDYQHSFAANASPLRRSWPINYQFDRSFTATTLKQSLPRTMAAEGLAHWLFDTDVQTPPRMTRPKRLQLLNWLPSRMVKP